jgi:arabinan endo-1,5-alpha-L-arabinosidase
MTAAPRGKAQGEVLVRLCSVVFAVLVLWAPQARAAAADPIAHDPTVIKQGAYYYAVITGDIATRTYLPIKRSKDLVHWQELGTVFQTAPAWVTAELGVTPGDFWAPDITYSGGRYRLYYAASQFATNNSVIGLATNATLDPASPRYHWVDEGMVLRSRPGVDDFNAIDPDVVRDAAGRSWLAFGSFWSGIKLRRLDAAGRPSSRDTTLYSLASRPAPGAVEGPSIVRHGGFYYLFVSFDFCCRGIDSDYRVMVGRARSVTGPYLDARGVDMRAGGGTELLRGYNEFAGPGGGDVFGRFYAHHYYDRDDNGLPKLSIRRISWVRGWPALGDPLSGSRDIGHGSAYFKLVERSSGQLVEDAGCGFEGANVQLAGDTGSPCQQWRLDDRGDGTISFGNRFSNKVAEVAGCQNRDGANIAQWGWLANDCQRWRLTAAGDGWIRIDSALPGDRSAEAGGCAANVQLGDRLPGRCQLFRLQPVGPVLLGCTRGRCPLWVFRSAGGADYTIHRARGGRPLTAAGCARCRVWRIVPRADGSLSLVERRSGRTLDVRILQP